MKLFKLFSLIFFLVLTVNSSAQYSLVDAFPLLAGFSSPVDLQNAGDCTNRIFIVEQQGRIKVFENRPDVTPADVKMFLDITDRVSNGGEMGLLGLAFHPDYENNGYFYVNYTADTPLRTVISRFQVSSSNPDSADKNTEFELFNFSQPFSNHNGGWVGFGPNDGYLHIATGDGGLGGDPENRAQNITELLGKILRIDIDNGIPYSIPPTNPFVDSTNALIKKEIYAWGLRNPWRCSFDHVTGWLWSGDVGQNAWEEIDLIENGKNYGWRCYEGNHTYNMSGCNYPEYIMPVWEYANAGAECSITGGYVYRGINVPELTGKYIYGDYCSNKIWALEYDGINPPTNQLLLTATGGLSSFGIDENNELYLTSFNGNIYRFTPTVTSIEVDNKPTDYSLEQNYPNPFNPATIIKYKLPEDSDVTIRIYDALGKEIDSITTGFQQKGSYQRTWSAEGFASGVYYVKMNAKSLSSDKTFSNVIKMLYLK